MYILDIWVKMKINDKDANAHNMCYMILHSIWTVVRFLKYFS